MIERVGTCQFDDLKHNPRSPSNPTLAGIRRTVLELMRVRELIAIIELKGLALSNTSEGDMLVARY